MQKQVNPNVAQKLIAEVPPIETDERTVFCDGGHSALGHPRVYIKLVGDFKIIGTVFAYVMLNCSKKARYCMISSHVLVLPTLCEQAKYCFRTVSVNLILQVSAVFR